MSTSVENTLKLALEALEEAWYHVGTFQPTEKAIDLYDEARAAIKEALSSPTNGEAQPAVALEQEPVAWGMKNTNGDILDCISPFEHNNLEGGYTIPLYTTPPQRTWVGLTDEEVKKIAYNTAERKVAKDIEAKLKEKNDC